MIKVDIIETYLKSKPELEFYDKFYLFLVNSDYIYFIENEGDCSISFMLRFKYCVLTKINRNHMTFIPKYNEDESFQNNLLQIKCQLKNEFQEITKK